ncbi:MAG TPA: hypothetical protein VFU43_05860 [Streptosporangiaceae bacterium]|nr:hypothetical protein [Streptosporangiaceae bacterium]
MVKLPSIATTTRLAAVLTLLLASFAVAGSASSSVEQARAARPVVLPKAAGPCDHTEARSICNQADETQGERIWQGRIHIGDEPGIYGDAQFPGAAAELPFTLQHTSTAGDNRASLIVETKDAQTFSGYPGHSIVVILHVVDLATFHAKEVVLARARLTSADNNRKQIPINLSGQTTPYFISVQVRGDEQVPPGAQDDFLLTGLSLLSPDFQFLANFGYNLSTFTD